MVKILLVEDETSIADNVRVALRQEGFTLDHAKTAAEGLRYATGGGGHSLLILDVGLPDRSGFELCKTIRKTSQTPILFLTARSEEVDKIIGFEIGGDDYLTKPFSPRELVARVRAILKRAQPQTAGPKAYGLFIIDPEKVRVTFDGTALTLSRYEFRLLEVLLRRPGVVFSRTQLMETVWEDPGMSLERTVDTHIKSIRAKLKEVRPDLNLIETHRGLGYSLKEA